MLKWIRGEFSGWRPLEWTWLIFSCSVICVVSIFLGDNLLGIASAVTGTLYALFAGKGKISCYVFGIFNTIAYGWISYTQTLYGEVMLNWGWYLPMMFVGIAFWRRNMKRGQVIRKTRLPFTGRVDMVLLSLLGIFLYAQVLSLLGDHYPYIDSMTTVLSITAMIMTVKRCIEQWVLWIIVNSVSIYMWYLVFLDGGPAASLLMWIIALANGFIFLFQWRREAMECPDATSR